ncbi:hypothetical protein BD410DRAFT_735443 [Rickenella mellea]|uniref:Uncharacterized protein n=1 Tax=Rickenella mellea TaxID=50990 RepID=A0A4Y7PDN6_9AGAM|nr:hypothetical protein BD410DRAFT_735443 [Rickenella mellea]
MFYDRVIRPAALEINAQQSADWPPTAEAEGIRSSGKNRTAYSYTRRSIRRADLHDFGNLVLQKCEENLPFGKGAFFGHQFRGTKGCTFHDPTDDHASASSLDDCLQDLDLESFADPNMVWFVDVGIELYSPGHVVLWRRDSHFNLIQHFLGTDERTAARNSTPGTCYVVDTTAHITHLAGFRLRPTKVGKFAHKVAYVQAYVTEKSLTYRPEGKYHAKHISVLQALQKSSGGAIPFLMDIDKLYDAAISAEMTGSARIELRVNITHAQQDLRGFPDDLIASSIVCVPQKDYWCISTLLP